MTTEEEKQQIRTLLDKVGYGTLALSDKQNRPYSVPVNFAVIEDNLYFHGSKTGRKMEVFRSNNLASFNVVEELSFIPSYFSSVSGEACPATQYFLSVIMDGKIVPVNDPKEKVTALNALMKKLQPEGKYRDLDTARDKNAIDSSQILIFIPETTTLKVKAGQNLSKERFERIIRHLKERNEPKDKKTVEIILKHRKQQTT